MIVTLAFDAYCKYIVNRINEFYLLLTFCKTCGRIFKNKIFCFKKYWCVVVFKKRGGFLSISESRGFSWVTFNFLLIFHVGIFRHRKNGFFTSEQTKYNGLFYMSQKQLPEGVPQPSSISRRDFITGVKMEILCVFFKSPLSDCFSSVKQEHAYRILKWMAVL